MLTLFCLGHPDCTEQDSTDNNHFTTDDGSQWHEILGVHGQHLSVVLLGHADYDLSVSRVGVALFTRYRPGHAPFVRLQRTIARSVLDEESDRLLLEDVLDMGR